MDDIEITSEVTNDLTDSVNQRKDYLNKFNDEKLTHLRHKRIARYIIAAIVFLLLILQNVVIFYLINKSMNLGSLIALKAFFAGVCGATLAETYFLCKLMVEWVCAQEQHKPDND
ncbi:TPA: hypothetical protein JBA38_14515 [Legionella pneumophila]|uniref:hypothetical protein n=1 Tax=Legionella pneumophila TaxID=446 RepID=UPI001374FCE1|nr:hypothetical protein [Legionella pneumophila]HAT8752897.1 hypothetical protein [Legionella pneumophila]